MKNNRGKIRAYFLSLILTLIAIGFVAGITVADLGSRSTMGKESGIANTFLTDGSTTLYEVFDTVGNVKNATEGLFNSLYDFIVKLSKNIANS